MGIRKIPGMASLVCGALCALCILTLAPSPADGQETPGCAGMGLLEAGSMGKNVYYSSQGVTDKSGATIPQFYVKSHKGKLIPLINRSDPSFLDLLFHRPRKREIVPAPLPEACEERSWRGRRLAFKTPDGVWVYTFSRDGMSLHSIHHIDGATSPELTEGGNLVYQTANHQRSTLPLNKAFR